MLRHYYRGGLPAKVIQDKFLWAGLSKSRAIQELQLLTVLSDLELPVPMPAAARVHKSGLSYQTDIVTVLIPDATTLSSILMTEPIPKEDWQKIGSVIKSFHRHNCCLLYTSPSPRDATLSRMPSSA